VKFKQGFLSGSHIDCRVFSVNTASWERIKLQFWW